MTTVVYRDGILASDSKVSSGGDIFVGQTKKIFTIEVEEELSWIEKILFRKEPVTKKLYVGFCGSLEDCKEYVDCIFYGEQQTRSYDASLIVVDEEGEVTKFDGNSIKGFPVESDYAAIGSGYEIALGAMFHGASAVEAVEAAIFHDNSSGGDIQILSINDDKK